MNTRERQRSGSEETERIRGFTLVELLTVVSIIALLIAILLPSLSRAKGAARSAACQSHLRTFSSAFHIYASEDRRGAMSSGAFDHLRDGDIRTVGWVADVIRLGVGTPGDMLCPQNPYTISEKVADYTGAATTGKVNPLRWKGGSASVPVVPVGIESKEFWARGYNTNYATTWQFSRGDPTASDGFGSNGDPRDPSKCPGDGDGPLSERHLSRGVASPNRIALMGDARAGDGSDSTISPAYADAINAFTGREVATVGDFTVESFTDGMSVDYSSVTGRAGEFGHEFNDIWPLHSPKGGSVGGFANVSFADGHVASIHDTGGADDKPDGFLGPFKQNGTFTINQSAFDEIVQDMWYGRLVKRASAGGGSIE